jgi:hypothetical protein
VTLCFFKKKTGLPPRCRSPVPVDRLGTNGTTPDRGFWGGPTNGTTPDRGFLGGPTNGTTPDRGFWGGPTPAGPGTPDTGPVPVASPVLFCFGFDLFCLKPCRFDLNSNKFSKFVLLRGDGVVNYRKTRTTVGLS